MPFSLFGQVHSSTVDFFHHLLSIRLDFLSIEPSQARSHLSSNGITVLEFLYLSHAFLLFCTLTVTLDASSSDALPCFYIFYAFTFFTLSFLDSDSHFENNSH